MQEDTRKTKDNSLLNKWLNREKKPEIDEGIKPRPKGVKIPLSSGQKRLLFLQQLHPNNPFYHYAETYRFKGKLVLEHLIKSFKIVAERHEILRTKVYIENGQAFQQINDKPIFEILEYDLRNVNKTDKENIYQELALKDVRKPLETSDGYLIRMSVLYLKDEEVLLVLTIHHIVMDKWSMRILLNEVAECYTKLINNENVSFSPLEIQYADYAYWQSLQKTNPQNLDYWKNKLKNSLTVLDLLKDYSRPNQSNHRGAYSTLDFSYEFSNKIKTYCKLSNKTLYVVLLTVYKILIHRYSGETDILVGSPFTNRDEIELEKLIGFFNDTLVLRSNLSNDPTFEELLEQVWETSQEAFVHKNMPFETLVKSLKIDRYLSYNPLFQVMFIYHKVPEKPYFGKNLEVQHEPFDFGVTKFDLTLFVAEYENKLQAVFEYSTDLFEESRIRKMHGHFRKLLGGIIENPKRRISELPIITNEEKELFNKWNETDSTYKASNSILELFEKQAKLNPTNPAVTFKNIKLTYEELDKLTNSVAHYLINLGLDKNKPVGLLVEQSADILIGILGIMKAGLAYLPLDAEYPNERLEYILKDSSASVVLTQKDLTDSISNDSIEVQTISEIVKTENSSKPILAKPIDGNDLAYVLYTSGSTGKPKGVAVTHSNLFYSTAARFEFYPNQPESFLLLSSFSFDSSVVGIFWTIAAGGKLVISKRRAEQDLKHLGKIFVKEKITHTLLLPSLYSTVLKNLPKESFKFFSTIIVAGESCPKTLCKEHFEKLPLVEFYNEYGPTEATVWATAHKITPEDAKRAVPIGKAIPNTKTYILDKNQNRVPIGVTGEMYVGGKGVAKGYFNNPELTNKRFVKNISYSKSSEKLYRTGDLCRFRSDGVIEFFGRKDNQVKVRGYRIELDEIQEACKQIPEIGDVVVKMENLQKINTENTELNTPNLLRSLKEMNFEEANETLKLIEGLSDKEIEFMLNEAD